MRLHLFLSWHNAVQSCYSLHKMRLRIHDLQSSDKTLFSFVLFFFIEIPIVNKMLGGDLGIDLLFSHILIEYLNLEQGVEISLKNEGKQL